MEHSNERMYVFVGSYAEPETDGIQVFEFDEDAGELKPADRMSGFKNPTFLNVDADNRRIYAIAETTTPDGSKIGEAAALSFDPAAGKLALLNKAATIEAPTCHIQRDNYNLYLVVASYHGAMTGLLSLTPAGHIGSLLDTKHYSGHSVHPERQDRPHPHSSFFSPDGRYLFVQDLGLDRITTYAIEGSPARLQERHTTPVHPGAGPRHLVFRPDGSFAYVINEVDSTVTAFAYDAEHGKLSEIETVSTLPAGFEGENTCAEIAISEDGRFLYGSNRGHDSIVVYAVDERSGKLTTVQHSSTEGAHPRHFALTPGGRYLLAANRDTDNIAVFAVDRESGKLRYTGKSASMSKPVCVQPFRFSV